MTADEHDGLVATEGVDEGSAASTAEGKGTGSADTADTVGTGTRGGPSHEEDPAGPLDVATEDVGSGTPPGQELSEGEG